MTRSIGGLKRHRTREKVFDFFITCSIIIFFALGLGETLASTPRAGFRNRPHKAAAKFRYTLAYLFYLRDALTSIRLAQKVRERWHNTRFELARRRLSGGCYAAPVTTISWLDGPTQNGCPGEAITPAELFLSSVAACGVELLQVIARKKKVPLEAVSVEISGMVDRSNQVRQDFTLFNSIRLQFRLKGVTDEQGAKLIATFQGR